MIGAALGVLFTTAMTLPLDAAATRATVVSMTTLMLGVGYCVSALAPVAVGAVRDATGSFTLPIALLAADAAVLLVLALRMPRHLSLRHTVRFNK
jgi:CP family cyanate transporter-like MFS transporter